MSKKRYGHTSVGGGSQNEPERKDAGWTSRQGGSEAARPGRKDTPETQDRGAATGGRPQGTNTQGDLAGVGRAADAAARDSDQEAAGIPESKTGFRERDARGAGTDQPFRMGGPLGADPEDPQLPPGAQDGQSRGTGAGGFDRGVDASRIGTVHQGVRPEDEPEV